MKDRITNQIDSYRARLSCLDRREHRDLWQDRPLLRFTDRVAAAREQYEQLVSVAGRQTAPLTGITTDKRTKRRQLQAALGSVAPAYVLYCRDQRREGLAAPFDLVPSAWQGLRDLALVQRARLLIDQITALAAGPEAAAAAEYGLHGDQLDPLAAAAGAFDQVLVAPRAAIADRACLTADLPRLSRLTKARFAEVEALLPQFAKTPAGVEFVTAYRKSRQVIDRGRRKRTAPPGTAAAPTDPAGESPGGEDAPGGA
jgi:hypothetical protein